MGAKVYIIIVLLFVMCASSSGAFDYYQLVLQNQINMCSSKGKKCQRIPKQEFTIHGLWPSNHTGPWLEFCSRTQFDIKQVPKQQATRLDAYWPDLLTARSNIGFWSWEWLKHGTCSENVYTQVGYFNYALDSAIDVRNRLASNKIIGSGNSFQTAALQKIIYQAMGAVPALKCLPKAVRGAVISQLTEIVICLGPTLPLTYQNCSASLLTCAGQIIF